MGITEDVTFYRVADVSRHIMPNGFRNGDLKMLELMNMQSLGNKCISILLVLYDCKDLLPLFIQSLKKQTFNNFDLYSIDCHQDQESITFLKNEYPSVLAFAYEGNLGYSGGNNFLFQRSNERRNYSFSLIINPDVVLYENALEKLVEIMLTKTDAAACGPVIYNSKPFSIKSVQNININANYLLGKTEIPEKSIDISGLTEIIETQVLAGCAVLVRVTEYLKSPLFPEENYMFGEELDLSYRASLQSKRLYICRDSKAWHLHDFEHETKESTRQRYYYIYRNRILFFRRYRKHSSIIYTFFREILLIPFHLIWVLRIGNIRMILAIYLGLLHGFRGISGRFDGKL